MDEKLLIIKVDACKLPRSVLAESLGLSRQGLYNKLTGRKEFKSSEIKRLSKLLALSPEEKEQIFFADGVDV